MSSKLHNMELHAVVSETIDGSPAKIIRVPGGWIYKLGSAENYTTTFVPYTEAALNDVTKKTPPAHGLGGSLLK